MPRSHPRPTAQRVTQGYPGKSRTFLQGKSECRHCKESTAMHLGTCIYLLWSHLAQAVQARKPSNVLDLRMYTQSQDRDHSQHPMCRCYCRSSRASLRTASAATYTATNKYCYRYRHPLGNMPRRRGRSRAQSPRRMSHDPIVLDGIASLHWRVCTLCYPRRRY